MSMTTLERRNPPPRRRSCAACTKAKRRCDFAIPACLRCAGRKIACQYPPRALATSALTSLPTLEVAPSLLPLTQSPTPTVSMPDVADFSCMDTFLIPDDSVLDRCLADVTVMDNDLPSSPGFGAEGVGTCLPQLDNVRQVILVGTVMPLLSSSKDGWEPLMFVLEERLKYTVEEIQRAPQMMAEQTRTPWCHSFLYKETMPKIMRDAHACCGMYQFKTALNGPVILRSVESFAQDLVDSPMPSTPLEILARTQALILYSLIRLFDGDISARAAAERHFDHLEASAYALLPHVVFQTDESNSATAITDESFSLSSLTDMPTTPDELPLFPLTATEVFWKNWILQESMRRTILFSFHLILLYDLMAQRKNPVRCYKSLACKTWTMSAHLWEAPTSLDFALAWKTKKHFVMESLNPSLFDEVVRDGRADDVESFGKMFLTTYMGVTQARGWFLSRGGML